MAGRRSMRIRKRVANSRSPTSSSFPSATSSPTPNRSSQSSPPSTRPRASWQKRAQAISSPSHLRVRWRRAPAQCRRTALSRARFRFRMTRRSAMRRWRSFLFGCNACSGPACCGSKVCSRRRSSRDRPLVIQGAQHLLHPPQRLAAWPTDDRRSRLVVIVDGIAPAEIESLWRALTGLPEIDRPDLAALVDNPLAPRSGGLLG